jgi:hypothetical protein
MIHQKLADRLLFHIIQIPMLVETCGVFYFLNKIYSPMTKSNTKHGHLLCPT